MVVVVVVVVVVRHWLLQQRETKASFVYIIFAILLGTIIVNGF